MSEETEIEMMDISWEQFHKDCRALVKKLIKVGNFKKMVAVTRGGLFPAGVIAREMEIRDIDTICIASYDEYSQGKLTLVKPSMIEGDGEGVLFVDDLVDTGRTIEFIKQKYPKAHIATVYAKEKGKHLVDTYVSMMDCWVLFPWEGCMQPATPMIKGRK